MKKNMNQIGNFIASFFIGIGIGNVISIFISLLIGKYTPVTPYFLMQQGSLLEAVIKANICYAIIGIICNNSSVVYRSFKNGKNHNLFLRTLLNLSINFGAFLLVGIYLKWFKGDVISPIILFLLIYFSIWIFNYIKEKRQIDYINKKLKNKVDNIDE